MLTRVGCPCVGPLTHPAAAAVAAAEAGVRRGQAQCCNILLFKWPDPSTQHPVHTLARAGRGPVHVLPSTYLRGDSGPGPAPGCPGEGGRGGMALARGAGERTKGQVGTEKEKGGNHPKNRIQKTRHTTKIPKKQKQNKKQTNKGNNPTEKTQARKTIKQQLR